MDFPTCTKCGTINWELVESKQLYGVYVDVYTCNKEVKSVMNTGTGIPCGNRMSWGHEAPGNTLKEPK